MPFIKELPSYERPREKMLSIGAEKLSNTELLAILIGTGTKEESAMNLAQKVISVEEDGLAFLGSAIPEDLIKISGVGTAKSCQIVAAVQLGKRLSSKPTKNKICIGCPEDIASMFIEDLRYMKQECFKVVLLNTKNEIISTERVSTGNINSSIVDPRDVFSIAVRKSASSMILVHNHPSGNPKPSKADVLITERLVEAGLLLDIKVVDHIIVGDGNYISLKRKKLM